MVLEGSAAVENKKQKSGPCVQSEGRLEGGQGPKHHREPS